jgi:hypothetical protein
MKNSFSLAIDNYAATEMVAAYTVSTPALSSASAQALRVAPVVRTSSTKSMVAFTVPQVEKAFITL